jgi:hypothetical protein
MPPRISEVVQISKARAPPAERSRGYQTPDSGVTPVRENEEVTHNFRLPDGVEYVGAEGENIVMRVEIPLDADGFFGRQCPSCEQVFRVAHDDYEALPDDLRLWCVYCGHSDDHSEFLTTQQQERIMRPAADVAMQMVGQMLDKSFGGLARRTRGSIISFSYRCTCVCRKRVRLCGDAGWGPRRAVT